MANPGNQAGAFTAPVDSASAAEREWQLQQLLELQVRA